VVTRDHLAQQPEGEELHTDDDQEHAEREQGALADRVAGRLEHGQVDQDRRPDDAEEEPEPAEEMERPMPVAAHERHGQQVEEPAKVALDSISRASVSAGAMVDGQLGDAEAAVVRQNRDEAVQLAVQRHPSHDLGPVGLETAVHVVQAQAGHAACDGVEDA
jgi:hypothetical protein